MFQLIYASTATRPFEEEDLRALVKHARRRNETRGITGVLVHRNGSFLHVIEGTEEDARALYERIRKDDRHRWVTLLKASATEERDFPDAPLAFRERSVAGTRRPFPAGNEADKAGPETGPLVTGRHRARNVDPLSACQRAVRRQPRTGEPTPGSASEAAAS